MQVITLLNEKGGVGKSTLSKAIAMYLAAIGFRTMLIDTDPQGSLTIMMGLKKMPMLYNLLVRDADWDDVITQIKPDKYALPHSPTPDSSRLYHVSSNKETHMIGGAISDVTALAIRIAELEERDLVDFVIIDTPPVPSLFHSTIYYATDSLLLPTELARVSFDGLVGSIISKQGADTGRSSRFQMPKIHIAGIIPTKCRMQTLEDRDNYAALKQKYGEQVWSIMRLSIAWKESEKTEHAIWQYAPNSEAVHDFFNLAKHLEQAYNVQPPQHA